MPTSPRSAPGTGRRILRWAALALAIGLLGLALALVSLPELWLAGPRPRNEAAAAVGLAGSVEIRRDAYGIAHVSATGADDDVWAGLGFAEAQDRACQVEMLVRIGEGRLSEWLGDVPLGAGLAATTLDRWARELGLGERAQRSWEGADDITRQRLTRFAAGANARLESLGRARPACFRLLATHPRRWQPQDPLLLLELYGLVGQVPGLRAEALAFDLVGALGADRARELLPPEVLSGLPAIASRAAAARDELSLALAPWTALGDPILGSNAWAVSPARSRSGAALLAADPHVLADRAPALWYLAHVEGPGVNAEGLFLPGTPLLAVGHTRHLAWGSTSTLLRTGGVEPLPRSTPLDERTGVPIVPRFGAPRALAIRRWHDRPVIDDPAAAAVLAVDLGPSDAARQLRGFQALLGATGVDDLSGAEADLRAGPLSWRLVLADAAGHIASRAAAVLPGHDPYALRDPAVGLIVSANSRPDVEPESGSWAGAFEPPDRATRIRALLDAQPRHSTDDFRRVQLDVTVEAARRAVPILLDDLAGQPALAEIVRALAGWDQRCERESAGCAAFELIVEALPRHAFADELGTTHFPRFAAVGDLARRAALEQLADADSPWWDDITTPARERRADQVRHATEDALAELVAEGGEESDGWNWGAFHEIRLAGPLAALPLVGHRFAMGPFAHPGDRDTLNAAGFTRLADGTRAVKLGPTARFVIDLASPERAYFACATGMSEDPFSGYAWNLTDPWLAGELFVESLDGPREVRSTVTLEPTPDRGRDASEP